ncbi:MAG: response regulator transcription factor [Chloroflexota bacterium]|nr:response regulator transcription factor [Chloroflexota bacterium]
MSIRVLIVDDSSYVRDGLCSILGHDPRIQVVGEAENGSGAIASARDLKPDVILMDAQMPSMDGIQATRYIKEHFPRQRIICLTVHPHNAGQILAAGASTYLLKDAPREELLNTIFEAADAS